MTWLRRNRLGLVLLPVAAALALGASSMRVVHFWWPYGPHEVTTARQGEQVHLSQPWQDRSGTYVREVDVTVDGIAPTTHLRDWTGADAPATTPPGTRLWRVTLTLAADPDQVLRGCQLEIIDSAGREYAFSSVHLKPSRLKTSPCLNPDEGGPEAALIDGATGHENTEPRPETWTTVADVLTAEDSQPRTVRIWWEHPRVIEVAVTPPR